MFAAVLINIFVVALCVVIHYEFLYRLSTIIPTLKIKHRLRIVLGVSGALIAHAVEVWVFAYAYYFMHHTDGWGKLQEIRKEAFSTASTSPSQRILPLVKVILSPLASWRYMTGIESLTGLVLITWTASFLYYEMQRYWDNS